LRAICAPIGAVPQCNPVILVESPGMLSAAVSVSPDLDRSFPIKR
jgi:hypothetical protein